MKVSPNPDLMVFHPSHAPAPKEWKSKQAKRLYEAGVEGATTNPYCHNTVVVARKPGDNWTSKYGTPPAAAECHVRAELARVRAECDKVEGLLAMYGPEAFVVRAEAVRIPFFGDHEAARVGRYEPRPDAVEGFLIGVLNASDAIWVNGVEFRKDVSNAFVRVTPPTPEVQARVEATMAEHQRNPTGRAPAALAVPEHVGIDLELQDE